MKICNRCRKELCKLKPEVAADIAAFDDYKAINLPSTSRDSTFIPIDVNVEYLNKSVSSLDESRVVKKHLVSPKSIGQ